MIPKLYNFHIGDRVKVETIYGDYGFGTITGYRQPIAYNNNLVVQYMVKLDDTDNFLEVCGFELKLVKTSWDEHPEDDECWVKSEQVKW